MYKVQKPCRVCGRMYTPCADCESDKTAFHWRTVACSRECGMKYFEMVLNARKPKVESEDSEIKNIETVEIAVVEEQPKRTKKSTKVKNNEESEQIE